MTQISDEDRSTKEEIERMIHDVRTLEIFAEAERDVKLAYALEELLSARETIRRLVKYTDHHSGCLSEASNRDGDCTCGHTALLAELEGKG